MVFLERMRSLDYNSCSEKCRVIHFYFSYFNKPRCFLFMSQQKHMKAKPFIKWAGGKSQLLPSILQAIPTHLKEQDITFIEPFVGGGAVFLYLAQHMPNIKKIIINDINEDVINVYQCVKKHPEKMIVLLKQYEEEFFSCLDETIKKTYFLEKRRLYNQRNSDAFIQASLFIFLNKTCFNGLYRVNRKNQFNVPIGSYQKPTICDAENIQKVSAILQRVEILCGDFTETKRYIAPNTLFYFDPPYKPLTVTANFNAYAHIDFDDMAQKKLADFCYEINQLGAQWILSNSDVKAVDPQNDFFDILYSEFNIQRVTASRNINSKGKKRGKISELLVTNQGL